MTIKTSVTQWVCTIVLLWPFFASAQFSDEVKPSQSCTTEHCPSGAYVIGAVEGETQGAELLRISKVLEAQGQVKQATGHWTNNRYAILLPKGHYEMSEPFHLGYYTQVLGVEQLPTAVDVTPGIAVYNQCIAGPGTDSCKFTGGLNNFWRGIENIQMTLSATTSPLILAISQATALRRLNVTGPENTLLLLCDYNTPDWSCGYTSGGFLANSKVHHLVPGSQQQWLTRNADLDRSETAVWNAIFVGSDVKNLVKPTELSTAPHYGPSENDWTDFPVTQIETTPLVREKPYLIKTDDSWAVAIPALKKGSLGVDWDDDVVDPTISIDQFHIIAANPDANGVTTLSKNDIDNINTALTGEKHHLIVMPGVYNLQGTINVTQNDSVILGLGIPALACMDGPCMNIDANEGVRLAGVTFDAGYAPTSHLLQVGKNIGDGNAANPHSLSDLYVRIAETQTEERGENIRNTLTAVVINSNYVIGDNLWIWRGDHDKASGTSLNPAENLVEWDENTARYGVIVHGANVTMYGLAVEHFQDYQTLWYGENGQVYFYQSEIPYDFGSTDETTWTCTDPKTLSQETSTGESGGCAAYVIGEDVENHQAYGVGVYSYFAFKEMKLPSAIKAPSDANIHIEHIIGHWLNGVPNSAIQNLIKDYDDHCYGYVATCSATDEDSLCTDSGVNFKQTSVLGIFAKDKPTQACTAI